jgi:hypothetical protein
VLALSHAATRRKCWTGCKRKPKNESVKKFLRAKEGSRGFESIESGRAKSLPSAAWLATPGWGDGIMLARTIDRIEELLEPYARAISIVAAIWFWLGAAVQARFVRLPEIPWLSESAVFWAGVAVNAVWWGFLNPALRRRRKARAGSQREA